MALIRLLAVVAAGLALAGCTGPAPRPAPTVLVTDSPTVTATATVTAAPVSRGCPAGGGGVPAHAVTRSILDVDGDGRGDVEWIVSEAGAFRFGITTASGATFWHVFSSASPLSRAGFVARVRSGLTAVFFTDSRSADVLVVHDCALVQLKNPQGADYTFDIGRRAGTGDGVGCADGEVVGLLLVPQGSLYRIRSTVVRIADDGATASNGPSTTTPGAYGSATGEVSDARTITCGSSTVSASGVVWEERWPTARRFGTAEKPPRNACTP